MPKDFTSGLATILGEAPSKSKRKDASDIKKVITKSSQIGTKENETRATFIVSEQQLESIKALAYWERLSIKELIAHMIEYYLETKGEILETALLSYRKKVKVSNGIEKE